MRQPHQGGSPRGRVPLRFSPLLVALAMLGGPATLIRADDAVPVLGPPPGSFRMLGQDSVVSFPFELFRGDIKFDGEINGHKVRMLLDNGVLWDQILFFGSTLDDSLDFRYDDVTAIVGGSGEGSAVTARTASGLTIRFPGVEFTDQTAVVMPHTPGKPSPWVVEGQVCNTFFLHFVVELDFDRMMLTLTPPDRFEPEGRGGEVPMIPLGDGRWSLPATLEMADGRTVTLDLYMDLGYGEQLEIRTTGEHGFTAPSPAVPGSLGFGIQGETLGSWGRVKSVRIGGYTIEQVIAGFVDPHDSGEVYGEVMVGLGLLSRFNVIYDYPHRKMYLEPNHTFDQPFEYDMSGLWIGQREGTTLTIRGVVSGSPAAEAGITAEDRIVRIDGRVAGQYADFWQREPLMTREGATVTLLLRRGEQEREVKIVLRRLI